MERAEIEALVEALIEEARQRARRRRQRYLEAALLALLVGFALYAGFGRSDSAQSVASSSFASSGAPSAGDAFSLSFRLLSVETSFRFVDRAPEGQLSKGDAFYVKDELRNAWADQFGRSRNAVVGSDSWVRVRLAKPGWELVMVRVKLPGGTLRLRARGQFCCGVILLRVVGGTGDFADARGTMKWQQRSHLPNLNDFALRLP